MLTSRDENKRCAKPSLQSTIRAFAPTRLGLLRKVSQAILGLGLMATAALAQAQDWPSKPVRLIVAITPGGGPDIVARMVAEKLSSMWGQQVFVENRSGAGGIPAMVALTRSPADGYTFGLIQTAVIALTPHLFKDPQFNVETDVITVSNVVTSPLLIAVTPSLGVSNLTELIKLAKSKPGQLAFAVPLANSLPQLAGDQISKIVGMKLLTVPYNGSGASITGTIAGDSQITIDATAPLVPHLKSGRLKAIAITSAERLPGFEEIPTVSETIPKFEAVGWFALIAPAHTPEAIVTKVNRDLNAVIQMPDIVARLLPLALYPAPGSPLAAATFVRAERERWAKVLADMGLKPE